MKHSENLYGKNMKNLSEQDDIFWGEKVLNTPGGALTWGLITPPHIPIFERLIPSFYIYYTHTFPALVLCNNACICGAGKNIKTL